MAEFDMHDTFNKVADIIAQKLSIDKSKVSATATLQDLGADSLDVVEIIMKVEEQFSIEIDDDQAERLKNVQDVVEYVDSLRKK
jgi:acyl carrier protein